MGYWSESTAQSFVRLMKFGASITSDSHLQDRGLGYFLLDFPDGLHRLQRRSRFSSLV